ncbi:GNAT family N-acetyltransferase [Colwellia demingiae]|uniref:GNAT family N-acetyltransferase n=1 Tax=Colwellia demingiae TaxID=89401 RepID=A0A5C6Q9W4_9GAMM|nr:GNAT family N-acetyltransferase [Colwellia demingiae]TWX65588.1 GNAT family N-acetyltransferase [Colwellia demingiae]
MNIFPITKTDLVEAADILSSSFKNYEVMRYLFNDSGNNYEAHITEFFLSFYQFGLANNWPCYGVKVNEQWVAVALGCNSSEQEMIKGSDDALTEFYKSISPQASRRIEQYEQQADAAHPKRAHFFIDSIGTHPDHQGKGYAKALILKYQELSKSDVYSTGVGLNTESDKNINFYQHLGYEVQDQQNIESLTSWSLFRADD